MVKSITLSDVRASVCCLVDALHTSAPDSYVESFVHQRLQDTTSKGLKCSRRSADAIVAYALKRHHDNGAMRARVLSGRL